MEGFFEANSGNGAGGAEGAGGAGDIGPWLEDEDGTVYVRETRDLSRPNAAANSETP